MLYSLGPKNAKPDARLKRYANAAAQALSSGNMPSTEMKGQDERSAILQESSNPEECQYLRLLEHVLASGEERMDRTGVGVYSIFGGAMRFSLSSHFPLLSTKKVHFKSVAHELLWFLRGDTNIRYLKEHGVSIWNEWADENGELGPVYGAQWRKWRTAEQETIDQIALLVKNLQESPLSRRHILSAWNVGEVAKMALPPCHVLAQFYVSNAGGLSCQLYQRSVDVFLGLPFNIASYALLTYILAKVTGLFPEHLLFTGGDVHLYRNHKQQALIQLGRKPYPFPHLHLKETLNSLEQLDFTDIILENYRYHPALSAPIAV